MKEHVVTAAVVTALISAAVLVASAGGNTWSDLQSAQHATQFAMHSALGGSEGGDSWAHVAAQFESRATSTGV